jgi:uncharacterized protein (TIGR02145 family)
MGKEISRFLPYILAGSILVFSGSCKKEIEEEQLTDSDGNVYTSVIIGTQEWMVESLKTTKYNDGSHISLVTDEKEWSNLKTPGYCWYDNNEAEYKADYGALYNWYCVSSGKLCPEGWHVPTKSDLDTLVNFLGGAQSAGGKLKEKRFTHWNFPNSGATNESGFTALPGGGRYYDGLLYAYVYAGIGQYGCFWSLTDEYTYEANVLVVFFDFNFALDNGLSLKETGQSVRCVKD